MVATLPSLEHLARGGRVPGIAAMGARWLGLQPVFEFRQGKVRPLRPACGRRLACQRIVALWAADLDHQLLRGSVLHVSALHALEPEVAEDLMRQVRAYVQPTTAFVGSSARSWSPTPALAWRGSLGGGRTSRPKSPTAPSSLARQARSQAAAAAKAT